MSGTRSGALSAGSVATAGSVLSSPGERLSALRRREFVGLGLGAGVALALGAAFWRGMLSSAPEPGFGYGPLGPPDANGISLPGGFRSRLLARGGELVSGTDYRWHRLSDGAATFSTSDGGWILVSNAEADRPDGGASAMRFNADGSVADAYRILRDTEQNCAGGPTPWGMWLSCEEVEEGRVWECDPTGERPAVARPALGVFQHEAATVDPDGRRLYLTEDLVDGGFYRFTPERYPDLDRGTLEIATVGRDGAVAWTSVPDPSAKETPTRFQVAGSTRFRHGEGIWFDSGVVYVATTEDSRIHAYDTYQERIEALYDASRFQDPPLTRVDNITVSRGRELFVCEDNDRPQFDIRLITPERQVMPFLSVSGPHHSGSELAGVSFDPSGARMYFASQRAFEDGAVYEVTGPFRATLQ